MTVFADPLSGSGACEWWLICSLWSGMKLLSRSDHRGISMGQMSLLFRHSYDVASEMDMQRSDVWIRCNRDMFGCAPHVVWELRIHPCLVLLGCHSPASASPTHNWHKIKYWYYHVSMSYEAHTLVAELERWQTVVETWGVWRPPTDQSEHWKNLDTRLCHSKKVWALKPIVIDTISPQAHPYMACDSWNVCEVE